MCLREISVGGDDGDERKHYQGSINILVVAERVGGFTKEVRLCAYMWMQMCVCIMYSM